MYLIFINLFIFLFFRSMFLFKTTAPHKIYSILCRYIQINDKMIRLHMLLTQRLNESKQIKTERTIRNKQSL